MNLVRSRLEILKREDEERKRKQEEEEMGMELTGMQSEENSKEIPIEEQNKLIIKAWEQFKEQLKTNQEEMEKLKKIIQILEDNQQKLQIQYRETNSKLSQKENEVSAVKTELFKLKQEQFDYSGLYWKLDKKLNKWKIMVVILIVVIVLIILKILFLDRNMNILYNNYQQQPKQVEELKTKKTTGNKEKKKAKEIKKEPVKKQSTGSDQAKGEQKVSDVLYTIRNAKYIKFNNNSDFLEIDDVQVNSEEMKIYVMTKGRVEWQELEDYKFILKD